MIRVFIISLLWLPAFVAGADEAPESDEAAEVEEAPERDESVTMQVKDIDEEGDDTPDIETEATVNKTVGSTGLLIEGDLRPIYDYFDIDFRNGSNLSEDVFGFRTRLLADYGITKQFHVGARLAGTCFTDSCDPDFVMEKTPTLRATLVGGEFTFDELYFHWFRTERASLALGRIQTRFVLRGGVYAKSLDRNNSNNVNINWTDGAQVKYRARNGWKSSFIWERNASDGASSVRWDPLDFDHDAAKNTYFVGFENTNDWGNIVQRGLDISYLPKSLLKNGTMTTGPREDYWGVVGRLMTRWPSQGEGIRLRAGLEMGYAPNTQAAGAGPLDLAKEADGLAWDVVLSVMDFVPGHSIGLNYARTGAGWLLSPQFRPNEELMEIRWMWRPKGWPFVEVRFRRREDLELPVTAVRKRDEFDMYARLTWEFRIKGR